MNNVISLDEYKNKKNGQIKPTHIMLDVSPELQARLLRISLIINGINQTMAELAALNTKKENK